MSRRRFLGGAATAGWAAAVGDFVLPAAQAAEPADLPPAKYFHAGDHGPEQGQATRRQKDGGAPPPAGLRWAFSATVFFADRVLLNTMEAAAGRGYTSVGGGEIWGPRLTGRVLPHSGADYYKAGFNTYYMFEARDGALIFIHNRGTMRRFAHPYQPGKPLEPPPAPAPGSPPGAGAKDVWTRFRATPVFTAPKGPHDWLNRTVFVANAQRQSNPDHTVFTYYEVL